MVFNPFGPGRKHKIFIILFLLACFTNIFCQKLKFDITLYGNKIGALTVEQKDSAGLKLYTVQSKTEAKILFSKRTSVMATQVLFDHNGNMVSSYYKNIKSDGNIITIAGWQNGKLNVDHNGEKSTLDGQVNLSSVVLYFAGPQKLQKIFSERAGRFFDMVRQTDGAYLASLDDGTGKFTYKDNRLVQIELSKGMLGTVLIKAVQ